MQVAPHRAPLLLVYRAAGCLGLEAVWAVLPMPGNAQERTGVVLKADRCLSLRQTACLFWDLPAKCSWPAFSEQMHEAGTGRRRSLWRPDQLYSV